MFIHESGSPERQTIVFLHGNGANGSMWKTHNDENSSRGVSGIQAEGMLAKSPSSFTRSFLQANSLRLPPGLEEVACRVLFVAGEREPQVVKQSQASLARLLPNADGYIAPGMGHGWLAEAPDLHCSMVRAWLQDEALPENLARVS